MEPNYISSMAFVIGILFVIWMGLILRDKIEPSGAVSHAWHGIGWVIRLLIVGIEWQTSHSYGNMVLLVILFFPIWNISCNIGLKRKLYYISNKGIDGLIRKCLPFINFDK